MRISAAAKQSHPTTGPAPGQPLTGEIPAERALQTDPDHTRYRHLLSRAK
jgi:hypothetical protein